MKLLNVSYKGRKIVVDNNIVKIDKQLLSKKTKVGLTGVYVIVNEVLKSCYVGQSINLNGRLKNHKSLLVTGKHSVLELQKDYTAFSSDFEFKILCHSEDDTDLLQNETMYISQYKRKGYRIYNTIHDTENPMAHTVVCQTKQHQNVLSRLNKLLQNGKISIAQLEYSIDYAENQ